MGSVFQFIKDKFTSRKFLLSLTVVIAGLVTMFSAGVPADATAEQVQSAVNQNQQQMQQIATLVQQIIGGMMATFAAIGWVKTEGLVDANRTTDKT
jgi:fructose-specific phosphotransferase system IIC component